MDREASGCCVEKMPRFDDMQQRFRARLRERRRQRVEFRIDPRDRGPVDRE